VIKTVYGSGYRFVVPSDPVHEETAGPSQTGGNTG
jgi:hypothetical protein